MPKVITEAEARKRFGEHVVHAKEKVETDEGLWKPRFSHLAVLVAYELQEVAQ